MHTHTPLFMQTYICGKGPVPLPQPTAAIFRSPCRQPPFHPPDRHSWEGSAAPADRQSWEGSPLPWPPLISTGSPSTHLHLRMHLPLRIFECTPCCYTPAMLLHPCHVVHPCHAVVPSLACCPSDAVCDARRELHLRTSRRSRSAARGRSARSACSRGKGVMCQWVRARREMTLGLGALYSCEVTVRAGRRATRPPCASAWSGVPPLSCHCLICVRTLLWVCGVRVPLPFVACGVQPLVSYCHHSRSYRIFKSPSRLSPSPLAHATLALRWSRSHRRHLGAPQSSSDTSRTNTIPGHISTRPPRGHSSAQEASQATSLSRVPHPHISPS